MDDDGRGYVDIGEEEWGGGEPEPEKVRARGRKGGPDTLCAPVFGAAARARVPADGAACGDCAGLSRAEGEGQGG